jgi:hypothetical protein
MSGLKAEQGMATLLGAKEIWFTHPDGNILNVFEPD